MRDLDQAIDNFEEFHARDLDHEPFVLDIEIGDSLTYLGKADSITYESDKWDKGKQNLYIHEFGEDVHLYCTADKKTLLITGGKLTVTHRGIEN